MSGGLKPSWHTSRRDRHETLHRPQKTKTKQKPGGGSSVILRNPPEDLKASSKALKYGVGGWGGGGWALES